MPLLAFFRRQKQVSLRFWLCTVGVLFFQSLPYLPSVGLACFGDRALVRGMGGGGGGGGDGEWRKGQSTPLPNSESINMNLAVMKLD